MNKELLNNIPILKVIDNNFLDDDNKNTHLITNLMMIYY